jgi:uncharacterized protein with FMN-binding domain
MRRITFWLFSTVAALVLLFSYRTSTIGAGPSTAATVITGPATSPTPSATGDSAASGSNRSPSGSKTYTGTAVATRWGDVQVSITVTDGRITDVQVPVYPDENHRDQEINAYALPVLREQTLAAQSADIDAVSGATVTSDGYRQSLQSALDAARLS